MKISIVTISFNQGAFLSRCIDSVLSQNYYPLEYIVVDPGSSDASQQIIQSYGSKIISVFEPDRGPADGLNKGFLRATGEVFGFINADDYLLPSALCTVAKYFHQKNKMHFVSGGGFIESPTGERRYIFPTRMTIDRLIYNACVIFQQGTFFSSDLFRRSGGFNPANHTCWDMELYTKFLRIGGVHEVINDELGVFSIHPESVTGSGRLLKAYHEDRKRIFCETKNREWGIWDHMGSTCLRIVNKMGRLIR